MYRVIGIQETGEEMVMIEGRHQFCEDWVDTNASAFPEFRGFYIETNVNALPYF